MRRIPKIVRLHVIAAGDTKEEQAEKLRVRDAVLSVTRNFRQKEDIWRNLAAIEAAARAIRPDCRAEYGVFAFPARAYENAVLPAGDYEAVRVVLGEGRGQNWFCVLYPSGCGVTGETVVFESWILNLFRKWGWL